jgi:hypothetical protein
MDKEMKYGTQQSRSAQPGVISVVAPCGRGRFEIFIRNFKALSTAPARMVQIKPGPGRCARTLQGIIFCIYIILN